jgi:hypothetical protein
MLKSCRMYSKDFGKLLILSKKEFILIIAVVIMKRGKRRRQDEVIAFLSWRGARVTTRERKAPTPGLSAFVEG